MEPVIIIPCLDMKNGRVVKGVHFVELVDAADPVEAAKAYCATSKACCAFLGCCENPKDTLNKNTITNNSCFISHPFQDLWPHAF